MRGKSYERKNDDWKSYYWVIIALLFAIVVFDLWFFFLWPRYGWYPFDALEVSDLKAIKIIDLNKESDLSEEEMERVVEALHRIKVYPPTGNYTNPEGGQRIFFRLNWSALFGKDISVGVYGKYFMLEEIPFLLEENDKNDHHDYTLGDVYSELVREYFPRN